MGDSESREGLGCACMWGRGLTALPPSRRLLSRWMQGGKSRRPWRSTKSCLKGCASSSTGRCLESPWPSSSGMWWEVVLQLYHLVLSFPVLSSSIAEATVSP